MWIDSSLFIIMLGVRFLFFLVTLFITHIVVADAAFMGMAAYVAPDVFSWDISSGMRTALALAVFFLVLILSKWKVTFAAITLAGSYFWAWFLLQLFHWETREHILATAIIMLVNIALHIGSREKIFGIEE